MNGILKTINEIGEGFKNHLFPKEEIKELIEQTSEERLNICKECEHYKENGFYKSCGKCGCSFPAKTKCLSCNCPINKWTALTTQEIELHLKTQMNEK